MIDLTNQFLSKVSNITLNNEPTDDSDAVTKSFIDSLSEIDRNRRGLSVVFNDEDTEVHNKLTNKKSITMNRDPFIFNEVVIKNYIQKNIDNTTVVKNTKKNDFSDKKLIGIDSV